MEHGFKELRYIMKPLNKVCQFINSMKDRIYVCNETDDVYSVSCQTCEKCYIGHTGMNVGRRIYFQKNNLNIKSKTNMV